MEGEFLKTSSNLYWDLNKWKNTDILIYWFTGILGNFGLNIFSFGTATGPAASISMINFAHIRLTPSASLLKPAHNRRLPVVNCNNSSSYPC